LSHIVTNKPLTISYSLFNDWVDIEHFDYNNFDPKGNFICTQTKTKPNIIAAVFEDWWDEFYTKHKSCIDNHRPNANDEVHKMIDCYNKDLGFDLYYCENCKKSFTCAHTCKSRFCSSCGIKYQHQICESILQTCHKVNHRQIVFTIPRELRKLFFDDFYALNILYEAVCDTLYSITNGKVLKTRNNRCKPRKLLKRIPGFFCFLHTFGRTLNWNPHIHVIIAETILDGNNFKNFNYFNYDALSRRFQINLLYKLEKYFGKKNFSNLKNLLFLNYKKGFYVYAEPKKFKSLEAGIKYVTRYCARPVIGLKRILNYNGYTVTICYNDHKDESYHEVTISVFKFMTLLTMHIYPKNFKVIRAYGFYNKKHKASSKVNHLISKHLHNVRKNSLKFANLIKSSFNKNPFECPSCGKLMAFQLRVLKKGYG